MTALDEIEEGECLAVIPRSCLLNCDHSCVSEKVKRDKTICQSSTSSWVPLLIALAAEYSKNVSVWYFIYNRFYLASVCVCMCVFYIVIQLLACLLVTST